MTDHDLSSQWCYFGRYTLAYLPEHEMRLSEWMTLDEQVSPILSSSSHRFSSRLDTPLCCRLRSPIVRGLLVGTFPLVYLRHIQLS